MTALMLALAAILAPSLPACQTEDSMNCVWQGPVDGNGNGNGATFVDIGGTPYYLGPTDKGVAS